MSKLSRGLAIIAIAMLAIPAAWSMPALSQVTDESTGGDGMTYEDLPLPPEFATCSTGEVCAQRTVECTYGWRGVSWCAEKPLWFETAALENDEIYPRTWVYYTENAIRNNRYARFRLCEDLGGQPDICMDYWWAAKNVKLSEANKWKLVTPPRSTDDCKYTTAVTHWGYYSQVQGRDGNDKTNWKNESKNVPNGNDSTQLDCIR